MTTMGVICHVRHNAAIPQKHKCKYVLYSMGGYILEASVDQDLRVFLCITQHCSGLLYPQDLQRKLGFFCHPGCSALAYTIPFGTLDTSL